MFIIRKPVIRQSEYSTFAQAHWIGILFILTRIVTKQKLHIMMKIFMKKLVSRNLGFIIYFFLTATKIYIVVYVRSNWKNRESIARGSSDFYHTCRIYCNWITQKLDSNNHTNGNGKHNAENMFGIWMKQKVLEVFKRKLFFAIFFVFISLPFTSLAINRSIFISTLI